MYCVKCGTQLPDHANFCLKCGAPQRGGVAATVPPRRVVEIRDSGIFEKGFLREKHKNVFVAVDIGSGEEIPISPPFKGSYYHSANQYGEIRDNFEAKQPLQSLMSQLTKNGWTPEPRKGEFWYSYFFCKDGS